MNKGLIFNIQKYSIHDGPGIRTTVFFKGCPLNCWWCHNPEGIPPVRQIMFNNIKCIKCQECVDVCENNAVKTKEKKLMLDRSLCNVCGKCSDVCPVNALNIVGEELTVDDIMQKIKGDKIFYDESGGGVTFSGGEPLIQHDFLQSVLKECRQEKIHTAVDTSGCVEWKIMSKVKELVDLFLYDVKIINNERHKRFTGRENTLIINNLQRLASLDKDIIIRIPVIPGINDDYDNIKGIGKFLANIKIKGVNILPYHKIGSGKYRRLGMQNEMPEINPPSQDKMLKIADLLNDYNLEVKIGG